ncbi:MAG: hypothetical protein LBK68_03520 [Candidatus Margulisbacteria bacterium]|nr:hypothetical protein [Candidatus Margulisiibacteriota bacterium]
MRNIKKSAASKGLLSNLIFYEDSEKEMSYHKEGKGNGHYYVHTYIKDETKKRIRISDTLIENALADELKKLFKDNLAFEKILISARKQQSEEKIDLVNKRRGLLNRKIGVENN